MFFTKQYKELFNRWKNSGRSDIRWAVRTTWKCHSALTYYCNKSLKGMDMFRIKNDGKLFFKWCIISEYDNPALYLEASRLVEGMNEVLKSHTKYFCKHIFLIKKYWQSEGHAELDEFISFLDLYSLSWNENISAYLQPANSQWRNDQFSVITVAALHVLHLVILEKLRECTVNFLTMLIKKWFSLWQTESENHFEDV